jgi:aryl-alcohol dehydrogenase-like predicted oxidoreductase
MEYVNLGESGLKVSRLCLGAMNFGTASDAATSEADGKRVIDMFLDRGNNFIDTANVYTNGQSEEIVGRAIADKRDQVVVATKGRGPQGRGPNDAGLSRLHLTRALDASLTRLKLDYVDLYQVHAWDADTPIEETMQTLDGFVRSGKVRYIGCSNFTGSQIVEAQWVAARQNGVPFISLQPRYSLVAREIEADVLPTCQRHGLGTLIYSPLGGGLLSGKYKKDATPGAETRFGRAAQRWGESAAQAMIADAMSERNLAIVEAVSRVAAELGSSNAAVAIAWCLTRRGVTSVIAGPRTADQMKAYFDGTELKLPEESLKRLSDVSRPAGPRVGGFGRRR